MNVVVTDTETTGVGDTDQIVEMACLYLNPPKFALRAGRSSQRMSWLMRPDVPITHAARATHHITDEMLTIAPSREEWLRLCPDPLGQLGEDPPRVVAHNLAYDIKMMKQTGMPETVLPPPERQICTWRCSLHLYPEAETHRNVSLWYELGLDKRFASPTRTRMLDGLAAHRAGFDVVVTGDLLRFMCEANSLDRLSELTATPVRLTTIRFGKYRGTKWADVDTGFLRWCLTKDFDEDVRHTCRTIIAERQERMRSLR